MSPPPTPDRSCLTYQQITKQVESFVSELDQIQARDLRVALSILERSVRTRRPEAGPSGRFQRIAGAAEALYELRVTPPGRRGPHTRILYAWDGEQHHFCAWPAQTPTKDREARH